MERSGQREPRGALGPATLGGSTPYHLLGDWNLPGAFFSGPCPDPCGQLVLTPAGWTAGKVCRKAPPGVD